MRVIICGAGQVGSGIAERLAAEKNDVSVIDTSPQLIHAIRDSLDVRGFVGHGSHPEVLEAAGAQNADMIIAVTLYDEVNIVACEVAHALFNVPMKIARIRSQSYLRPHYQDLFSREHLPIDVIISPEVEVGETVLRHPAPFGADQLHRPVVAERKRGERVQADARRALLARGLDLLEDPVEPVDDADDDRQADDRAHQPAAGRGRLRPSGGRPPAVVAAARCPGTRVEAPMAAEAARKRAAKLPRKPT